MVLEKPTEKKLLIEALIESDNFPESFCTQLFEILCFVGFRGFSLQKFPFCGFLDKTITFF